MTESTEHALENMVAGVLFYAAVVMLIWLHGTFLKQVQLAGWTPERLIMVEQSEER